MRQANITTIKEKIMEIRFGILKMARNSVLKSPVSLMIKTIELTDDGHLLCTTTDASALKFKPEGLPATLKFVQKSEGLFIKLTGRAVISNSLSHYRAENDTPPNQDGKSLEIRIRIDAVYCFKKKSTSPYTSFLQSLGSFTGNLHQIGQAV